MVITTGFAVQRRSILFDIFGSDGKSIALLHGSDNSDSIPRLDHSRVSNLVLMTGPNTGLANNSMVVMIEAQAAYAASIAAILLITPIVPAVSRAQAAADFTATDGRTAGSIRGRKEVVLVGIWTPKTASQRCGQVPRYGFRRRTRELRLADYVGGFHGSGCLTTHSGDPIEAGETASPLQ